jgi:hypothetical protein
MEDAKFFRRQSFSMSFVEILTYSVLYLKYEARFHNGTLRVFPFCWLSTSR